MWLNSSYGLQNTVHYQAFCEVPPFSPHLLLCREIKKIPSLPLYLSPVVNLSFRNLCRGMWVCGGAVHRRFVILQWTKVGREKQKKWNSFFWTQVYKHFLRTAENISCLPCRCSVEMNRCSPSASY